MEKGKGGGGAMASHVTPLGQKGKGCMREGTHAQRCIRLDGPALGAPLESLEGGRCGRARPSE